MLGPEQAGAHSSGLSLCLSEATNCLTHLRPFERLHILGAWFIFIFCGAPARADVETAIMARTAMSNVPTYHFFEVLQTRGRVVAPDLGYVDFGKSGYREVFGGGGLVAFPGKHFTWIQEAYFVQSSGPAARGAAYLQPWTFFSYSVPGTRLVGQTVYFIYLPVNQQARVQHVLDRAKLEYEFRHFKLGAGYAGYKIADKDWQNKPFLTFTLKAGRAGSFEFWVQRLPASVFQMQVRYVVSFKSK